MNQLSVCAIVKNEGPYLQEWIEFNLAVGVEHFFIFNNESTDNTAEILFHYQRKGLATVLTYLGEKAQMPAYSLGLQMARGCTKWLAFIDVDEFLYSPTDEPLIDIINRVGRSAPGVVAHWVLYGSSGQQKKETGLVTERFTRCEGKANMHIKSIVRPEKAILPYTAHAFLYSEGLAVDENGTAIPPRNPYPTPATANILRINHYVTKSREECDARRSQKRSDTGEARYNLDDFFSGHDHNEVEDKSAWKIWTL
jgi:glycosyltransferase involved in cell wall biosynthesis